MALLFLPLAVWAQEREFTGRVDSVDANRLVVDNRMGDEVSFAPASETAVEGQGRTRWAELKPGDRVTVFWKMTDEPRIAHRVRVLGSGRQDGDP